MMLVWVIFVQTCMQCFICNALSNDLEVLPANKKLGFVSNGNCTILPVDLCCMKFRHRLNILKKQTCMPKQNSVGAQPVHRNFCASINCFVMDSLRHMARLAVICKTVLKKTKRNAILQCQA